MAVMNPKAFQINRRRFLKTIPAAVAAGLAAPAIAQQTAEPPRRIPRETLDCAEKIFEAGWSANGSGAGANAEAAKPGTLSSATRVAGSIPTSAASSTSPSLRRTRGCSSLPAARAVVTTRSAAYTTPLAGRPRPCTCTTEGAAVSTMSAM